MKRKKRKPWFTKQELDAIKRKVKREKSRINFVALYAAIV